jgi:hypothetical protein
MKERKIENKPIEKLFSALSETLNEIGYMRTIHLLRKGQENIWNSDLKVATESVCEAFNITPDVLFGTSRKYPRKYAFALWVYVSYNELNYTLPDLMNYTHKSLSTIVKSKRVVDEINTENAFDKKIFEKLQQCVDIVKKSKIEN